MSLRLRSKIVNRKVGKEECDCGFRYEMRRRSCGGCGKLANVETLKRLYPNSVVPKFILAIALWIIGVLDAISIESVLEKLSKSTAYICLDHVVHANRVVITARDLWVFINDALKKYHGTEIWPENYVEEEGLEEKGSAAEAGHAGAVDESRTATGSPVALVGVAEDVEMVGQYIQSDDGGSSRSEQVSKCFC
ncbi:hypothetical protein TELCIR_23229 [Teladorsagia circumcincta]|uniref:Uncharacterized protein n=1 Tax=Teladorsagia circumcincta TaxID=45464 RepID=A0A2G9TBS7_TELCI|nr:hypothetical protein TELCIR_23229 [Teladorsagia circumcincta]